jgi:hypothetical protein
MRPVVRFGATVIDPVVLHDGAFDKVHTQENTRISSELSQRGMSIAFNPPLIVKVPGPVLFTPVNVEISRLSYNFYEGEFELTSKIAYDPFGINASIFETAAEEILESKFKDQLPTRMKQNGYNPWSDPNPQATVNELRDFALSFTSSETAGPGIRIHDPYASVVFHQPFDICEDVGGAGSGVQMKIEKGQKLFLSMDATGNITSPRMRNMTLQSLSDPGIRIGESKKNCDISPFQSVNVKKVKVNYGGRTAVDYEIGAETLINGMTSLAQVGLTISGQPTTCKSCKDRIRLDKIRTMIDGEVEEEIGGVLSLAVTRADALLPEIRGFSISGFIGIAPQP